ncbi:MAG: hypothetical protein MMC33_002474 [Icmadophila ericetorum]|nr:hypothetical protein [Icmadophila ericetorum]
MSTKEEEATQEVAQEAGPGGRSEQNYGPPAYELHRYDTLYTDHDAPERREPPNSPLGSPLDRTISTFGQGNTTLLTAPLSLTMDDDLIYPTEPPSTALYHIPRRLTWTGDRVFLERSVPEKIRKNGTVIPTESQALYEIIGRPYSSTLELVAKRASCYGQGKAVMVKPSIFHESNWEVWFQKVLTLKNRKGKWTDPSGNLLATEEKAEKPKDSMSYKQRRVMVIEADVNQKMMNLLVACWTAKVWRELQSTLSKEHNHDRIKEALKTGSEFTFLQA